MRYLLRGSAFGLVLLGLVLNQFDAASLALIALAVFELAERLDQ